MCPLAVVRARPGRRHLCDGGGSAGSVRLQTPAPQETATGTWNIRMRIDLPKEPALATVPFRFTFNKTVYYERAIGLDNTSVNRLMAGVRMGF